MEKIVLLCKEQRKESPLVIGHFIRKHTGNRISCQISVNIRYDTDHDRCYSCCKSLVPIQGTSVGISQPYERIVLML